MVRIYIEIVSRMVFVLSNVKIYVSNASVETGNTGTHFWQIVNCEANSVVCRTGLISVAANVNVSVDGRILLPSQKLRPWESVSNCCVAKE